MKSRLAPALLLGAAACSLINSPEDLKPVPGTGGEPGSSGSSGTGTVSPGGADIGGTSSGDTGGSGNPAAAGSSEEPSAGVGGCSADCGEAGSSSVGKSCVDSAQDCEPDAPVCDQTSGECRACGADMECPAMTKCSKSAPTAGRCVQCVSDADCSNLTPVCGPAGMCHGCSDNDQCGSGVCEATGACAASDTAVYALAETGSFSAGCGTIDLPCGNLATAVSKLTTARHTLVLQKTTKNFIESVSLPALKLVRVIGNGVRVAPYDGSTAFGVSGGSVSFEDMLISGVSTDGAAGIACKASSIVVARSTFEKNSTGVLATDCDVTVTQSLFSRNGPTGKSRTGGVVASCTTAHCTKTTTVVRNRFLDNGVALYFSNQASATVENNLFLRNGYNDYTRVLELVADKTRVAYNTLVENFNNGIYIGIVACNAGCSIVGNVSFNNFPGHPEYDDQVFYGGGTMTYNLTEVAYPGTTNKVGDPKFVDAAKGNYTPGPGSPALDTGNAQDYPKVDIDGRPRPGGAGPDRGAFEAP